MKRRNRDSVGDRDSGSVKRRMRARSESGSLGPRRPKNDVWVELPPVPQTHYAPRDDDEDEDPGVPLPGETPPGNDADDDVDETLPIRTLDRFSLFNASTKKFVSSERLLADDLSGDIVGVGVARPYADDDDLDDLTTEGQRLLLSSILECSLHWVLDDEQLDQKIYLRTQNAWYILLSPAPSYARYHLALQRKHHVTDAIISWCLMTVNTTVVDLLVYINGPTAGVRPPLLRYTGSVTADDLTSPDFISYFAATMDRLSDDSIGLYQRVLQASVIQKLYPDLSPSPAPSVSSSTPQRFCRKLNDVEKNVLQHSDHTVVTTRVGAIAQSLFSQELRTIPMSADLEQRALLPAPAHPVHREDPTSMEWVEHTDKAHIYRSVQIDGILYKAGDFVIVQVGDDSDKGRSKNATSAEAWCPSNSLANKKWFCRINYFFEEPVEGKGWRKFFHAQWLVHGSKTLLQEAAHPRALYWLNECDDLGLECIYSACNVTILVHGQPEPLEEVTGPENNFFLGLTLDDEAHSFKQQSPKEIKQALAHCDKHRPCFPCGLTVMQEIHTTWTRLAKGGYTYQGIDYHVDDFVYVHTCPTSEGSATLLDIAQITQFVDNEHGGLFLRVRLFGRYDKLVKASGALLPRDNRRLVRTNVYQNIESPCVEGKAFVACPASARAKETWVQRDDHFYCDLSQHSSASPILEPLTSGALAQCMDCNAADLDSFMAEECLMATHGKLRGLELFAGAGGLSTGLEMSGFIETKWAVEFSPSAAKTFRANHAQAVTYNQSSNCLLEHAINNAEGKCPSPLYSIGRGKDEELPPLPPRGEVDFIYGGPPCQSFSMMNHCRRPDDKRSTLVCNMISYVEFYRPQYFLLENVAGIFSYHLDRQGQGKHVVKKLKMGVVKFILRALTALGYQIQFRILQAGQYGAPQGRRRVIFLGARGDMPMPAYPIPQYAYSTRLQNIKLPIHEILYPTFRVGHGDQGHQCAPLPAVTINDAISDLPKFDWQNPHTVLAQSEEDVQELKKRQCEGILTLDAVACRGPSAANIHPGFNKPHDYLYPPLTRYQMWLRGEGGDKVTYHYTLRYQDKVIERVCNIPMTGKGRFPNHTDLPVKLQMGTFMKNSKSKTQYQTVYGRLHGDGHFLTAMTSLAPNCKGGRVIHPNQKRVLTVREYARSQGFPDAYQFLSTNTKLSKVAEDQLRQIGNAVPVPLALALGKEIGKALIQLWDKEEDEA
ncbi:S-adenosyl-L-methionine-dependent methyltransferase [Lentinus brumalis]|uniref:Cytosine-specific methyltransferase n=1 Tax=Lentinus brumalis TaxID=2498619 RepID=A0A371DV33_9APHY|nr:S-adenosyl-L-methionine-dependent methyltransferase [Polyporus brumalis]